MNKYILFLLLFVSAFAESQNLKIRGEKSVFAPQNHRTGTSFVSWTQVAQTDTMQSVNVNDYSFTYYNVASADSVSIAVSYMPSYDGITYFAAVLIDSLSNANNAGNTRSFIVPVAAAGLRSIKFVRQVKAFQLGVTTPTLKEQIVQIK